MSVSVYDDEKTDGAHTATDEDAISARSHPDQVKKSLDSSELGDAESKGASGGSGDSGDKVPGFEKSVSGGGDNDRIGSGYKSDKKKATGLKGFIGGNRNKLIGGGLCASLVAVIMLAFTGLSAFKTIGFVEGIKGRSFSASDQMGDKMSHQLTSEWISKYIMTGMRDGGCTTTRNITRTCIKIANDANPASALFNAWRDAHLETKLYEKYGIEIVRTPSNDFQIRMPGQPSQDIGRFYNSDRDMFEGLNNRQFSRAFFEAMDGTTRFKRMRIRFQYASLLQRKYGVRLCLIRCDSDNDTRRESRAVKRQARAAWFVERFVQPNSELTAAFLDCMLSNFSCANTPEPEADGRRRTDFERTLDDRLLTLRATYGTERIEKLSANVKDIKEKGIGAFIIKKIAGETAGKIAAKFIPIAGQIQFAAETIQTFKNAGPALKMMTYAINTAIGANVFGTLASGGDEIRAGHVDLDLVGQVAGMLGPNPSGENGTGDAFASPIINKYYDYGGAPTTGFSLAPTAYAATPDSTISATIDTPTKTWCNDRKVPKAGTACSELDATGSARAKFVSSASDAVLNNPVGSVADGASKVWLTITGPIYGLIGKLGDLGIGLISVIPGVKDAVNKVIQYGADLLKSFFVPPIMSSDPDLSSGSRIGEVAAFGAEGLDSENAHYSLGGQKLSKGQESQLVTTYLEQQQWDFEQKPLYARLFDIHDYRSAVSRLIMRLPSSWGEVAIDVRTYNPVGTIGTYGSSVLIPKAAAADLTVNPFNIPKYATPDDNPVWSTSKADYWKANCEDPDHDLKWAQQSVKDPDTGTYMNTTSNPCKNIKQTVCSLGGVYNTDLCDPEDINGPGAGIPPESAGSGTVGDIGQPSADVPCATGTRQLSVQDGYSDGKKIAIMTCAIPGFKSTSDESSPGGYYVQGANGEVIVNSRVSGPMLALFTAAKADGITLSANSSFRTMAHQTALFNANPNPSLVARPGYSNHQLGVAVDYAGIHNTGGTTCSTRAKETGNKDWEWLYNNAQTYGFKQYSKEAWHWDASGLSNRCGK